MNESNPAPSLGPYKLLTSVHYKQLSWEPGEVVTFPKGVNVAWLLKRGAIAPVKGKEVREDSGRR